MSYPIHITNIYELLNEDGEQTSIKVQVPTKDTKQPVKSTPPTKSTGNQQNQNSKPVSAPTKSSIFGGSSSRGGQENSRGGRTQESRGGRGGDSNRPPRQGGERPPRSDRPPRQAFAGNAEEGANSTGNSEFRNNNRERRGGDRSFGERRGRGAPTDGFVGNRRVFDRKSGTGREREFKKGGAGKGNWGKEGDVNEQIAAEDAGAEEGKEAKEEKVEEPEVPKVETEEEKKEREEREKEEKNITLDTYFKQREAKAFSIDLPTERKANEGVDQAEAKKWGTYQQLKRDDDVEEQSANRDKKKKEKTNAANTSTSTSTSIPIDQVFAVKEQPRREDRGDRGDRRGGDRRGGSRGGRGGSRGGRGGNRGGRGGSRADAPQFDENSFPTLATK